MNYPLIILLVSNLFCQAILLLSRNNKSKSNVLYFSVIMDTLSKQDDAILKLILPLAPSHSIFVIHHLIRDISNTKFELVEEHYTGANEERISKFLVDNGLAEQIDNRPKMPPLGDFSKDHINLKFTESGRKLKEIGDLDKYREWVKKESKRAKRNWNKIGALLTFSGIVVAIVLYILGQKK